MIVVRDATAADREWIGDLLRERWHSTQVSAHGELIDVLELPALVVDDRRGAVATDEIRVGDNDNLSALRFYMRRGFRLIALRPGAVDEARKRKPAISLVGQHGIPIHDELELCLALN